MESNSQNFTSLRKSQRRSARGCCAMDIYDFCGKMSVVIFIRDGGRFVGLETRFSGAAAGGQHEAAMRSSGKNERITRNSFVKKERGVKSGHAEHTNVAAFDLARGLVKCQNGWGWGLGVDDDGKTTFRLTMDCIIMGALRMAS